jgi:hypothetical protein
MLAFCSLLLLTLINLSTQIQYIDCSYFKNVKYSPCLGKFLSYSPKFRDLAIINTETFVYTNSNFDHIHSNTYEQGNEFIEEWTIQNPKYGIPHTFQMNLSKNQINVLHLYTFRTIVERQELFRFEGDENSFLLKTVAEDDDKERARVDQFNRVMKFIIALFKKVHGVGATEEIQGYIKPLFTTNHINQLEKIFLEMNLSFTDEHADANEDPQTAYLIYILSDKFVKFADIYIEDIKDTQIGFKKIME